MGSSIDKSKAVETRQGGIAQAPTTGAPGWGAEAPAKVYSRGQILAVMASVLLGILLAALDQTIVGPALPKIIGDLQGFEHYSWVVTIYLLTSTISVPIVGKLSDMYGRKWFYAAGIVVFVIGSALSGLSADMLQLIIFRGIQGLGAGVLFGIAFAIIADVIPPADRGKWQGVFGSVFGLASVVGPTVGGFLTDNLSWRWVFYVNVPIGAIALAVLLLSFPKEDKAHVHKSIDWLGAGALVAGITPLLMALSFGGTEWAWGSWQVIGSFVMSAVFLVSFIYIESRAREPIIPLDIFKHNVFTVSSITVFMTGLGMFGAIIFIPLFIQAVQGDSATNSGNAVTPMTFAIIVSSVITGQLVSRLGKYRVIGIVGMALVTLGMFLLWSMDTTTPRWVTIVYMIVMGLGMGVAFPLYTLVVQNAFPLQRVGVVTAALTFFRSIGGTVGTAILGTLVNAQFHDRFPGALRDQVAQLPPEAAAQIPVDQLAAGLGNISPQALLSEGGAEALRAQLLGAGVPDAFVGNVVDLIFRALKPALFGGIQTAFLIGAIMLAVGLVATIFLKEIPLRKGHMPGAASAMAEGGHFAPEDGKPQAQVVGVAGNGHGWEAVEDDLAEVGQQLAVSGLPGGTTLDADDLPRVGDRR
ncbi:MAG: MDR family MFS transporter [Chloroflexia bacterium]